MQLTGKKLAKYLLTTVLVIGVILALGFLSFTGMLTLCGLVGVAIGSFVVTAMIEGEVYAQSIVQGIEKLLKGKWLENKHLKNAIYLRELNRLSQNPDVNNPFLQQYARHLHALEKLKHKKEKLGLLFFYFFSDEFKKAFERAEKLVAEDQKYFIALMEEKEEKIGINDLLKKQLLPFVNRDKICTEIAEKSTISPWCLAAGCFAGIGMGLVFFSVAPESIVATAAFFGVALSASAFPIGISIAIAILAIMAAVGYMVLVYHTLTSMLQNDTVKRWMEKIEQFFSAPENHLTDTEYFSWLAKKIAVAIGVTLLVAVCLFATIATTGTWWYAAQIGATFILPKLEQWAILLGTPLVIVMGVGQLGFNLYNSFKTADIFKQLLQQLNTESVSQFFQSLGEKIKAWFTKNVSFSILKCYRNENLLEFLNPFRAINVIIEYIFCALAFIDHVISSAVMGDRFKPAPLELNIAANTLNEITSDLSFFIEHDTHDHEGDKHSHTELEPHKHEEKGHSHIGREPHHYEEEGHSHTDIPGKFLFVLLLPISFLNMLWDLGFSAKRCWKTSAIKAFFGADTLTIWSKQKEYYAELVREEDCKTASANKINRLLNNTDKVKQLTDDQKAFFRSLSEKLSKKNNKTYESIFSNAKEDFLLTKNDTQREHAENFLTKVMCF